jgi:protein-S-isoprenylcysteine O-methyltransferase Ste14
MWFNQKDRKRTAMGKLIIFILGSLGIILISKKSLPISNSHGFHRFFAFELLLILFLVNWEHWVEDPSSLHQMISWPLLVASLFLAVHGFYLLWVLGKPRGRVEGSPNLGFENTTRLVTIGAYKYIRHPLYGSLLLLGWGIFFKYPTRVGGLLALGISICLIATAKAEENENTSRFGEAYSRYQESTKMFIPWVI